MRDQPEKLPLGSYLRAAVRVAAWNNNDCVGMDPQPYCALGLAAEAGEIANIIQTACQDTAGFLTDEQKDNLAKKLGNTLWYVAALADTLTLTLDDMAERNLAEAKSRFGFIKPRPDSTP